MHMCSSSGISVAGTENQHGTTATTADHIHYMKDNTMWKGLAVFDKHKLTRSHVSSWRGGLPSDEFCEPVLARLPRRLSFLSFGRARFEFSGSLVKCMYSGTKGA